MKKEGIHVERGKIQWRRLYYIKKSAREQQTVQIQRERVQKDFEKVNDYNPKIKRKKSAYKKFMSETKINHFDIYITISIHFFKICYQKLGVF